ncbi:MAG: hypothetical protein AB7E70_07965 [Hyphomicrobiaceae bacterium]
MEQISTSSQVRLLGIVQIAVGIGILGFWLLFHTVGMAPANPPPGYFAFEHSFLPPDTILALALVASGWNVLAADTWGRSVALVCAGGLLFLGIIDLTFNLQNGMYGGAFADALQAAAIPFVCTGVGVWIVAVHGRAPDRCSIAGT